MEADNGGDRYGVANSQRTAVMPFSATNIIRAPVSALLVYMRERTSHQENEILISETVRDQFRETVVGLAGTSNGEEVAIRIMGASEQELESSIVRHGRNMAGQNHISGSQVAEPIGRLASSHSQLNMAETNEGHGLNDGAPQTSNLNAEREDTSRGGEAGNRDSSYQRHYIQQAARCIEQVLPFSLLLLLIFIRQHLQGFFIIIWISAVMFKSNDIIRKQTALKGEKKSIVLICYSVIFMVHVVAVHWWYWNDNLLYPMIMLPPKTVPPFWHAVFITMVNDILVRQATMVLKCVLLIYYKNSKVHNFHRQGQMLTLIEYWLLLYRAVLPAPVWYRFFLNKEYGGLFSSLMTGLYLTFKLTSIVEKVQFFVASVKALLQKEVHYGAYATSDQVIAAGDMCAICQEKMRTPILLCCKHIFCEDCVSEWFERERTCPLCRALVKPTDLISFADGSTSLLFQLF